MPTIDNKQLIHESNIAIADDTLDIYYGIEADSTLEPGLYKTEILYTAVPKPEPPRTAKAVLGNNGKSVVQSQSGYESEARAAAESRHPSADEGGRPCACFLRRAHKTGT